MLRHRLLGVGIGVVLASNLAVVVFGHHISDRQRLHDRLDAAPVPVGWRITWTVDGSGDEPLGDATRPWVVRHYISRSRIGAVDAITVLRSWGCGLPLRTQRPDEVLLQASCGDVDVALTVSSRFVYTASARHEWKTVAPRGGAVASLWIGYQGP